MIRRCCGAQGASELELELLSLDYTRTHMKRLHSEHSTMWGSKSQAGSRCLLLTGWRGTTKPRDRLVGSAG